MVVSATEGAEPGLIDGGMMLKLTMERRTIKIGGAAKGVWGCIPEKLIDGMDVTSCR